MAHKIHRRTTGSANELTRLNRSGTVNSHAFRNHAGPAPDSANRFSVGRPSPQPDFRDKLVTADLVQQVSGCLAAPPSILLSSFPQSDQPPLARVLASLSVSGASVRKTGKPHPVTGHRHSSPFGGNISCDCTKSFSRRRHVLPALHQLPEAASAQPKKKNPPKKMFHFVAMIASKKTAPLRFSSTL